MFSVKREIKHRTFLDLKLKYSVSIVRDHNIMISSGIDNLIVEVNSSIKHLICRVSIYCFIVMELKICVHLIYPIEHTINFDVKGSFAVI